MNAAIPGMDARLHAAFAARGMADVLAYAPPAVGATTSAGDRRCFVNPGRQQIGADGRTNAPRDVIGLLLADGAVQQFGRLTAAGGATYELRAIDETDGNDGSLQYWVVRHV
ncbi:MAG: hypothetical protein ACTHK2_04980 [Dokdonella sp.]|uniref:hypothetical protein n=1 Tax=Dokdonella sp. TaxID=2291710 RepID=UPI003F7CF4E4